MTPKATVLYDARCGFCRWSLAKLLAWDRRGALRSVAIESEEGGRLLAELSWEERMASWHLVAAGRRYSAAAALPPCLRLLPGGGLPSRLCARMPRLTEAGYALVARNRGKLGGLLPAAARRRADERIARREASV